MERVYRIIGINECGEEFYVDRIAVQEMEDFTTEELANMVLAKRYEKYRDQYNEEIDVSKFYIEPDFKTMSLHQLEKYGRMYYDN